MQAPPVPQSIFDPPQLSVGPLQVMPHDPLPHFSMTSPHASYAVHATLHAYRAGHSITDVSQLSRPLQVIAQARSAGQVIVRSLHSPAVHSM